MTAGSKVITGKPAGKPAGPGRQRVKKGGNRTPSSRAWLERQLNDPFVVKAKREGYRSRAAYKLLEIDDRHKLFKAGGRVVDLGAAPGGWSQIAAVRVGRAAGRGKVVAIDVLPIEPIAGVDVMQLDFLASEAPEMLLSQLGSEADVVMSDMAANATGHRKTDHLKIMGLAEAGAEFARSILAPGGSFLAKVLQGGTEIELLNDLRRDFSLVKHLKPAASRPDSAELYVLAMGFRGRSSGTATAPRD